MDLFFYAVLTIFCFAGIYDLKTSNVPDYLPYFLILLGIINSFFSRLLLDSLILGSVFWCFGYLLFKLGAWGDGDFWLFASLGFLFPKPFYYSILPYPISLSVNLLLIGSFYSLIYIFCLLWIKKKVRKILYSMLKDNKLEIFGCAAFSVLLFGLTKIVVFLFLGALPLIYLAGKSAEKGLVKKVHVKKLKGDEVLVTSKEIRSIDPKTLSKLKKTRKYVYVKEGIRWVPTFPITLFVLKHFGSLLFLFL